MKDYQNINSYLKHALVVVLGILGCVLLSYREYLFASQEGTVRVYNPQSGYREEVLPQTLVDIEQAGEVNDGLFDFFSDVSYQKFLDTQHALSPSYLPDDIVEIHSDFTANDSSAFQLRAEAAESFATMARAFATAFGGKEKLSLTSAYRSPSYQKKLASNCSTERCASAGTSEHEAGLAVDLGVNGGNILGKGGKYYQWMAQNAHLYGFHNTYQKGIAIDGKMVEPWHWRYVGIALATHLYDSKQTLAEYFYSIYPTL